MSTLKEDLTAIKEIQDGLVSNKVARFSYTQKAYTDNIVDGVDTYNVNNEQNIPNGTAAIMKVNDTIINKGYRAQASSITRMLMNHFLGRISYNLNKINDNMQSLLDILITKFPTSLPADGGNADTANTANTANTASKVANSLTFGSKTFNGSSAQTITASDLGLLPPDLSKLKTINLTKLSPGITPFTATTDGWITSVSVGNPTSTFITIDDKGSNKTTPCYNFFGLFTNDDGSKTYISNILNCPYPVKKGQIISVPSFIPNITISFASCLDV